MIKKAQIQFICITMAILLGVFTVIFGISYYIMRNTQEFAIEKTLVDTEQAFIAVNEAALYDGQAVIIVTFAPDEQFSTLFFGNQSYFNENQIADIVNTAIKRPNHIGSMGNFYYKITTKGTSAIITVADMSESLESFNHNILTAFTSLLLIYGILLMIVWAVSYKVFQPIKDNFYKQKQFISNASHELRTPLTIISANADVLDQSSTNPWINSIKAQTQRMSIMVEDMLTLAKIDENELKLSSIEFNLSEEIVNDTLPFDAVAFENEKQLELEIDPNIRYKGDLPSIKKITNILLDNAIKHATKHGTILVKLNKENGKIIFSVFNSGSDIPPEDSNKIFERFYRGDTSRSRESGGSGLGLAIAKSIADANKWKIFASSKLGESMTITIVL